MKTMPEIKLLKIVDVISEEYYGGHYTVFNFTTNIKFSFGTITDRDEINDLIGYDDINDAIINAIQSHFSKEKSNYSLPKTVKIPKI